MPRTTRRPRDLITVPDAAARRKVSTRTVRRWISDGRLRAWRVGPRLVRIDPADLDQMTRQIETGDGTSDH